MQANKQAVQKQQQTGAETRKTKGEKEKKDREKNIIRYADLNKPEHTNNKKKARTKKKTQKKAVTTQDTSNKKKKSRQEEKTVKQPIKQT